MMVVIIFRPHCMHSVHKMRPIATDGVAWSVCLLDTFVSPAEIDEPSPPLPFSHLPLLSYPLLLSPPFLCYPHFSSYSPLSLPLEVCSLNPVRGSEGAL